MIVYPDVIYSTTEYEHEVAAHADDPFSLAIVDIFWHGTRQYQSFIERDGMAKHQDLLRQGREGVAQWQDKIKACETGCCKLEAQTLEHRRSLFKNTSADRSDRVGKTMYITIAMAVETFRKIEANNAASIKKLRERAKLAHGQIRSYKSMVERLTAALVMYQYERPEGPANEAKLPGVSIQVNAAVVGLQTNLPAPEITIKHPNDQTACLQPAGRC